MGFSLSWVAVAPEVEQALIERLGLKAGTETSELAEFDLSAARLPGWYLLWPTTRTPWWMSSC